MRKLLLFLMLCGTATAQMTLGAKNSPVLYNAVFPNATVGTAYSFTPTARGGVQPYTWGFSCIGGGTGCLPPGITQNTSSGLFSGTPTTAGIFAFGLQVTDSLGNFYTLQTSITVISNSVPPPLTITSCPLPTTAEVGTTYPTTTCIATGGTAPYSWSTSVTPPCPGLTFSSAGTMTGTPVSAGSCPFTVMVTDAGANVALTPLITIVVSNPPPPLLTITNSPCGNGTVGLLYTCTLTATGGVPPYTWTLNSGANPSGTTLTNASNVGTVSGVATTAQTVTPQYKVADTAGGSATQNENITISAVNTCGPPGYVCTSTSAAVLQAPTPPFSGTTGRNQIACDTSLYSSCNSTAGTDPIVRLTDSTVGSTGFVVNPSGGAGDNIFSLDDSKIMLIPQNAGSGCVMGFTPSTMQGTGVCTTIPNSHSITWSQTNPNVLYTISANSPAVYKTTFTSPTAFTQVKLFDPVVACSALIPAGTYSGGSVSLSNDDNIVYGAIVTSGQNSLGYVFAYNQTTTQCSALYTGATTNNVLLFNGTVTTATLPCAPIGLHNSNLLLNGTWARMTMGATTSCPAPTWPQPFTWNVGTTTVSSCNALSGHNANGWNLEVQIANPVFHWGNVTSGTYCTDLASQSYGSGLMLQNGQSGDIESHFTANYLTSAETQPIIVGTAWNNRPAGAAWVAPTINEIWAFQRSPFKIQRFTHLWNSSIPICPSCDFRVVNGIISQSQTGKFAAFSSDMNLGLGTSVNGQRIDVFIVRLD